MDRFQSLSLDACMRTQPLSYLVMDYMKSVFDMVLQEALTAYICTNDYQSMGSPQVCLAFDCPRSSSLNFSQHDFEPW